MPDPSNPTTRVLSVINFLAAHPTEAFTLAEIARHLGLSNGSAHRILTTMVEARYLSRNERHKTYSLGITLVAVGEAAVTKHRGIEVARREITRLAVELDLQCSIAARMDDELLLLAKEGSPQSLKGMSRVGERQPLLPPVGLSHIAWSDAETIRRYIGQTDGYMSEAQQHYLLDALALIRQRGYSIAGFGPAMQRLRKVMFLPIGEARDETYWNNLLQWTATLSESELQLIDLEDAQQDGITYLSAPVFSPAGEVVFEVVVSGVPGNLSATEVARYADRLCAAAEIITSETHGRVPLIA